MRNDLRWNSSENSRAPATSRGTRREDASKDEVNTAAKAKNGGQKRIHARHYERAPRKWGRGRGTRGSELVARWAQKKIGEPSVWRPGLRGENAHIPMTNPVVKLHHEFHDSPTFFSVRAGDRSLEKEILGSSKLSGEQLRTAHDQPSSKATREKSWKMFLIESRERELGRRVSQSYPRSERGNSAKTSYFEKTAWSSGTSQRALIGGRKKPKPNTT
ncbi:hypothetical protein B0H16DRAFT_1449818 [Mycena metata]|uniref:Uncharacterized protein n=1 Tax=Mycena metata TaxID=1033252 RepID=A0AAD7NV52_9AGAR|nr:hypothetical protein B0H16DRAFT_1449818 [Mycena metata]